MNEAQQQVRSTTQAGEPLIQQGTDLPHRVGSGVGQPRFHLAMRVLFGIQVRGLLRQGLDDDLRMINRKLRVSWLVWMRAVQSLFAGVLGIVTR